VCGGRGEERELWLGKKAEETKIKRKSVDDLIYGAKVSLQQRRCSQGCAELKQGSFLWCLYQVGLVLRVEDQNSLFVLGLFRLLLLFFSSEMKTGIISFNSK
jgi:hypothetical protein